LLNNQSAASSLTGRYKTTNLQFGDERPFVVVTRRSVQKKSLRQLLPIEFGKHILRKSSVRVVICERGKYNLGSYLIGKVREQHDYFIKKCVDFPFNFIATSLHDVVTERTQQLSCGTIPDFLVNKNFKSLTENAVIDQSEQRSLLNYIPIPLSALSGKVCCCQKDPAQVLDTCSTTYRHEWHTT
jgi:hypothetical protein